MRSGLLTGLYKFAPAIRLPAVTTTPVGIDSNGSDIKFTTMAGRILGLRKARWDFCVACTRRLRSIRDCMFWCNWIAVIYSVDELNRHAGVHHLRRKPIGVSCVYRRRTVLRRVRSQGSHCAHSSNHPNVIRVW